MNNECKNNTDLTNKYLTLNTMFLSFLQLDKRIEPKHPEHLQCDSRGARQHSRHDAAAQQLHGLAEANKEPSFYDLFIQIFWIKSHFSHLEANCPYLDQCVFAHIDIYVDLSSVFTGTFFIITFNKANRSFNLYFIVKLKMCLCKNIYSVWLLQLAGSSPSSTIWPHCQLYEFHSWKQFGIRNLVEKSTTNISGCK